MPEQLRQELFPSANIGIIGYGIVGQAIAYGFDHQSRGRDNISWYDKFKPNEGSLPLETVIERSEFIFICLPTPMLKEGFGIELSIIDENITKIAPLTHGSDKIVVIKSTVEPGTTREYAERYPGTHFAFNPEFLTEKHPLRDFLEANRTVIGADNDLVSRRLAMLYQQHFPTGNEIFQTDPTTAEAVKYFANTFLALKVAFANEWYDLCEKLGIKYEEVRDMAVMDPRIGRSHTDVTSVRGFGGKCLPKDMSAIIGLAKRLGVDMSIHDAAFASNLRKRVVRDWEDIPFVVADNPKLTA